jgi:16S rRNA (guanine(966)-N(2))-methyltransferase RsmD
LRIIAGQLKGKRLQAPAGYETRPITDRIKENLFNIFQLELEGAAFLDLFSGSGSVGIEAISRGAHRVVMVERSVPALKALQANLDNCAVAGQALVLAEDVFLALNRLENQGERFTHTFIDPPFTEPELALRVLTELSQRELASAGKIVIRVQSGQVLPECFDRLERYRVSRYGESTLHFYMFQGRTQG